MKPAALSLLLALALVLGCNKQESKPAATPGAGKAPPATAKTETPAKPAPAPTPPKLDGPTAAEILAKAAEAYGALTNYSAKGKTVSEIEMSSMDFSKIPEIPQGVADSPEMKKAMSGKQTSTHEFTIKLARPSRYVIEWEMKTAMMPGMPMGKGAVWSDGSSHYLMMTPMQYSKIQNREMALASATGISGGAANTVPAVFYPNQTTPAANPLKTLQNTARWPDETVDGEDCYVVEGWLGGMAQLRYWLRKQDQLIKQRRQILGGSMKAPSMTDDDLRNSLKAMNQEATPEKIDQMRKMMEGAMAMASKAKGSITETHSDIRVDQPLKSTDFVFRRPTGAQLVASPLDQMMKGQPMVPKPPSP